MGSRTVAATQSPSGGSNGSLLGSFSCSSSSGVYTRTYMAGTTGSSIVFSPTVDASAIPTATLTLTSNTYSLADSTTSKSKSTLTADNTDYALLTFTLRDAYGNPVVSSGRYVQFVATPNTLGTLVGSVNDVGDGTYTQIYKAGTVSTSGSVSIQAQFKDTVGDSWQNAGSATSIAFTAGSIDTTISTFTATKLAIPTNGTTSLIVTLKDAQGNLVTSAQTVAITKSSGTGTIGSVVNNGDGTYSATVTAPASSGSAVFAATLNGSAFKTPLTITYANYAGTTLSCADYAAGTKCGGTCAGADLYIESGTMTIDSRKFDALDCAMTFNSITIGPGGVLTHSASTSTTSYGLELTVTGALTIQSGGSINVNGKGYVGVNSATLATAAGFTAGNTQTGGANGVFNSTSCQAGGSHGGKGGLGIVTSCYTTSSNALYDTPSDPAYPGASGAGYSNQNFGSVSGNGGGVVRITAGSISIASGASITANGNPSGNGNAGTYLAGGAGGSIKLTLTGGGKLTGAGTISANGGAGGSGAVNPSTQAGAGGMIAIIGDDTSWPLSQLTVNSGSTTGFQSVQNNATGGTIYRSLGAYTTAQTLLSDLYVDGSGTNILGASTPLTIGNGVMNIGLTLVNSQVSLSSLTVTSGAYITSTFTPAGGTHSQVSLNIANTLTINSGGQIITDGRGYPAVYGSASNGYTVGNTTVNASTFGNNSNSRVGAAGSHGGRGGLGLAAINNPFAPTYTSYNLSANAVYDSVSNPIYPGASGATHTAGSYTGGNGGGVIIVTAGNIINNGIISSNGNNGTLQSGGAGAGGTVNLTVSGTLTGSGSIRAAGGSGVSATYVHSSAGGGRIAINGDDSAWPLSQYNVSSGSNGNLTHATGGTIYRSLGAYSGAVTLNSDLIVDNSGSTSNILGPNTQLTVAAGKILTIDIATSLASLTVNGIVTHSYTTPGVNPIPKVDLTVSGAVTIAAGGSINADYRGYPPGYTVNNSTSGASLSLSGASYGGRGGMTSNASPTNATYGSASDPAHPGSGSTTASGGGLIRITASGIVNNGTISADSSYQTVSAAGGDGASNLATSYGGSGGGIKLTLSGSSQLTGSGNISASARGAVTQLGASNAATSISSVGGGGRIAIIGDDTQFPLSQIYVNAGIPLTSQNFPNHWYTPGTFYRSLGGYVGAQTMNSDFWINADTVTSNFLGSSTNLTIATGKTLMTDVAIMVNNLTMTSGSLINSFFSIAPNIARVDITAAGTITVPAGANIDVSSRGFIAGYSIGNSNSWGYANGFGLNTAAWNYGANHLAKGGSNVGANPLAGWDSASNPNLPGGGGNSADTNNLGGNGGGVIRLTANTLSLAGSIKANGATVVSPAYASSAGAGGSIYINAPNLVFSGSPVISANAGVASTSATAGASAGGLVKIETPTSLTGSITPTATSGTNNASSSGVGAGTVTGP